MKRVGEWWVPDHETLQVPALEKGPWQIERLEAAMEHVTDWTRAIDGGAHVGTWTCRMAERFEHVVAYEPASDTYACLEENVKEWRADHMDIDSLVELRRRGLGETAADGFGMAEDGKYYGGNTGGRYLVAGTGQIKLEAIDDREFETLGLLKLDLEGYELFALRGAVATLRRCRPIVIIEDKPRMAPRFDLVPHAAVQYLQSVGMRVITNVGADFILDWG